MFLVQLGLFRSWNLLVIVQSGRTLCINALKLVRLDLRNSILEVFNNFISMENTLQDISREKTGLKIRALCCIILLHTFLWRINFYSDLFYYFLVATSTILGLILRVEMDCPNLGQFLKAMFLGVIPAITVFLFPRNFVFAICGHFVVFNYGFNDLKWIYMHVLVASNVASWAICWGHYQLQVSKNNPETMLIKAFFVDHHRVLQVLQAFGLNYLFMIINAANKYMDSKTQQQYDSKLLQLNTDLEAANNKLQTSNQELQEALEEKENFILRFSHEIRNPLNSLLGNIELCYEQAADKELEYMLQDAKVSGEILLQLLNNVLDTAKVATGRLEVSVSSQNIRRFLERSWIISSEIIRKKRLYGCLSVNRNVPEVLEFDHHRLMQILINTVSNAAKFTDAGYVKMHVDFIRGNEINKEDMLPKYEILEDSQLKDSALLDSEVISEKPTNIFDTLTINKKYFGLDRNRLLQTQSDVFNLPRLSENYSRDKDQEICTRTVEGLRKIPEPNKSLPEEGYIRFEISDSGCGILQKDLENVFKKFQQVNTNSSKRQIGTGLGLWITRELIEMMNGNVEIFSKPNRGTTIVIMVKSKSVLMSLSPKSTSADSCQKTSHVSSSNRKVLIVEDITYNQEVNTKFFNKCGIEDIMIVDDGKKAVDLFLKNGPQHFDLILMDIDMPNMDGKTAVKIIRQEEKRRGWRPVNIVFLTGFAEAKTQKELLDERGEYRANGFYSKPASLDTFKRIVKEFIPQREDSESVGRKANVFPSNQSVLVVDDDSFNLTMLTKVLKLCGVSTLEARNGKEAIQLYEENWRNIRCIMMDCEMPVMDGITAAQKIIQKHRQRAIIEGKMIEIYGLTGHVGKEYRQKCLDVGMVDVLEKPIKIETLSAILKNKSNRLPL